MTQLIQSEWHRVERRLGIQLTLDLIIEVYPDLDEDGAQARYDEINSGEFSVEDFVNDADAEGVPLDWEWLDEDDWWTMRKGGYDVTYDVEPGQDDTAQYEQELQEIRDQMEQADDEATDTTVAEHPGWPFPEVMPQPAAQAPAEPSGARHYTITLSGRGSDRGVGELTPAQFEYWSQREDQLSEALNDNFDYDEAETPPEARLPYEYYNEYTDVGFWTGPDSECHIEITGPNSDEVLFSGSLQDFVERSHGDDWADAVEETEEFYFNNDCMKPGYYVYWAQGGKGTYWSGTLVVPASSEFDPRLLKFQTVDFNGNSIITSVSYNDQDIDYDGGDNWGKWDEYEVFQIEE
jgi:hypothetical protein